MFQPVLAEIHSRGGQPRALMPLILEGNTAGHCLDEGILRAVLGVRHIFHKGIADAVDSLEVP